jgi:hypothetical protein
MEFVSREEQTRNGLKKIDLPIFLALRLIRGSAFTGEEKDGPRRMAFRFIGQTILSKSHLPNHIYPDFIPFGPLEAKQCIGLCILQGSSLSPQVCKSLSHTMKIASMEMTSTIKHIERRVSSDTSIIKHFLLHKILSK